jgi:protein O-mannosyl-transferase
MVETDSTGRSFTKQKTSILVACVVIIAAGVFAYSNSFQGVFLYDDWPVIGKLSSGHSAPDSLWNVMQASSRPVTNLTFFMNYLTGGSKPADYHATNLIIHILTALLMFGVVRRSLLMPMFGDRFAESATWLALASASIWVCHPLTTACVTYIVQRHESLMGMFFLLTLYGTIRGSTTREGTGRKRWYATAVIACLMGMGSKEVMIVAPVAVLLYDIMFIGGSIKTACRERWGLYLGLLVGWPCLGVLLTLSNSTADIQSSYALVYAWKGVSPFSYAITQLGVITEYLKLAIIPTGLCFDYWWPPARLDPSVIPAAMTIGGAFIIAVIGLFRKIPIAYPLIWFFLILAPTSSFIPRPDPIVEHRMYLPLMGMVVLGVMGAYMILGKLGPGSRCWTTAQCIAGGALYFAVLVSLIALTVLRNADYRSEENMWRKVILRCPDNMRAYVGLGATLLNSARNDEAEKCFEQTLTMCPQLTNSTPYYFRAVAALTCNNMGVLRFRQHKYADAERYFRRSLEIRPKAQDVEANLERSLRMQQKQQVLKQ